MYPPSLQIRALFKSLSLLNLKTLDHEFVPQKNSIVEFLLVEWKSVGQPKKRKQPDITDYFPLPKSATKQEAINYALDNSSDDSVQQLFSKYLDRKESNSAGNVVHLKRVHGPPKTITLGKVKSSRAVPAQYSLMIFFMKSNW